MIPCRGSMSLSKRQQQGCRSSYLLILTIAPHLKPPGTTKDHLGLPGTTWEYLAEILGCLHSSGDSARAGGSPQYPVTGCNRHLQLGPHLGPFTRVALPSLHRGRDWPSVQCRPRPLPSMDVGQPKKVLEVVHCGAWCHHGLWSGTHRKLNLNLFF